MTYPLSTARGIAEEIIENISSVCERVEIAGSIRRERPFVKDIEICVVPRWSETSKQIDLFNTTSVRANLLYEHLKDDSFIRWIKPGTNQIIDWHIKPDGKYWRGLIGQIKLDLFIANKENFGAVFLVRTGSSQFSNALYLYARNRKGFDKGQDGFLVKDGKRIETPNEADVFNAVGLPFLDAAKRNLDIGNEEDYPTRGHYYDALIIGFLELFEKRS